VRPGWPSALVAGAALLILTAASTLAVGRARETPPSPSPPPTVAARDRPSPSPSRTTSPTPSPSPSPTPSASPSPSPTPSATPLGAPADFSELAAQVSAVRGLPLRAPLDARIVDAPTLAAKIAMLGFGDTEAAELESDRRLLAALRLVPPDLDLRALLTELLAEQILGVYVPAEETLYVRGSAAELSPYARITAAHEITHALQDQAYDLEALRDLPERDGDAALAVLALVEGDAVRTQQAWSQRFQTAAQRQAATAEAGAASDAALARTPRYLRESLFFPYTAGTRFAAALPDIGAAFMRPPTTTEQILHPERYTAGEGAKAVTAPATLGADWAPARQYTFGEFDVAELVVALGPGTAAAVGAGWGGGEVTSFERAGDTAVGVALVFDTAGDAAEACEAVPAWYRAVAAGQDTETPNVLRGDRDWLAWSCPGAEVRFGVAPDPETAQRLAA
jgi:hypothetical protein